MKKIIAITITVLCLISVVSAVAMGKGINVFENLSTFKMHSSSIDTRLDKHLDNPEKYQEAMDESLELFASKEYEKIANEIETEQENSREYLYSYLSDVKCALNDCKIGLDASNKEEARQLAILEQQISIYDVIEAKAKLCDDSEINSLFKKCKMITETMVAGEKIPEIPNELR